jgi:hypothetical protein
MADDGLDMEPLREDTPVDQIRVIMDLSRLGELIAAIATKFALIREIDPPDYDGEEMKELALYGWQHCLYMSDRSAFAESVKTDLEMLELLGTQPRDSQDSEPQHRPEFGL